MVELCQKGIFVGFLQQQRRGGEMLRETARQTGLADTYRPSTTT